MLPKDGCVPQSPRPGPGHSTLGRAHCVLPPPDQLVCAQKYQNLMSTRAPTSVSPFPPHQHSGSTQGTFGVCKQKRKKRFFKKHLNQVLPKSSNPNAKAQLMENSDICSLKGPTEVENQPFSPSVHPPNLYYSNETVTNSTSRGKHKNLSGYLSLRYPGYKG